MSDGYYVTTTSRGSQNKIHREEDCERLRATAYEVREATDAEIQSFDECKVCGGRKAINHNPDWNYYKTLREAGTR